MNALTKAQETLSENDLGILSIQGEISPCSKTQGVSLIDKDGLEYCILQKGAGVDLLDSVSLFMSLTGKVVEIQNEEERYFTILVRSYKELDS